MVTLPTDMCEQIQLMLKPLGQEYAHKNIAWKIAGNRVFFKSYNGVELPVPGYRIQRFL